jgi:transmembrane sensor
MIKDKDYYRILFNRYADNDCSPEEAREILDYIQQHSSDRILLEQIKSTFEGFIEETSIEQTAEWSKNIRQKLSNNIQPAAKIIPLYKKWLPRVAAALIILTGSIAFYKFNSKSSVKYVVSEVKAPEIITSPTEILPGKDKALLTLSDGSVIVLDETKNGNIAIQGNTAVNKRNNELIYDASGISTAAPGEITFNTITTPKGGQYQVVLPDGSKVWLNAASTLRFPTMFTPTTRNVELKGEGYFEVAKDAAKPFHVKINSMEIEVLGTHFNVMGYDNETALKTTLLEGAVKINYGTAAKILKPGQQAKIENTTGNINIIPADIEQAVAWKNGSFLFVNEDIKSIMRQLSRWYDIEVAYEGKEKERYFSGEVSRNVSLSQALKILDFSNVKFRINEKKMVVIY